MNKHEPTFLPICRDEMAALGWDAPDVVLITGDAYVDHPAFGAALIGRWLMSYGFSVAILAQPDWRSVEPFRQFGRPRLFWAITSGCIDSRLNAYASLGNKRAADVYSPGGRTDLRPDRPLLAYAARARQAYPETPIILGGLEASLRRLAHYDYIEDQIKRSVLIDAKADLLVYGMAERPIVQIAQRLAAGKSAQDLTDIPGVVWRLKTGQTPPADAIWLTECEQLRRQPEQFMACQLAYERQAHPGGKHVAQQQNPGAVVVNPPPTPLSQSELDRLYSLPFARRAHPIYDKQGGIPALAPAQFSIATHRGCFGGCSFCAIYYHQGKSIASRSIGSIVEEADRLRKHPDYKGVISDIGGPTANMFAMACPQADQCPRASCLYPTICPNLDASHTGCLDLMEQMRRWAQRQKARQRVYVASGIRHDLALRSQAYLEALARDFVGGHLKVAPEHYCPNVLALMRKPPFEVFLEFQERFAKASAKAGKKQFLVPYFISGHPGCAMSDAVKLTEFLVRCHWRPRQVQDFVPAPMCLSTAMFVSGRSPAGKPIYVPKGRREKRLQLALMQYYDRRNEKLLAAHLKSVGKDALLEQIRRVQRQHTPAKERQRG